MDIISLKLVLAITEKLLIWSKTTIILSLKEHKFENLMFAYICNDADHIVLLKPEYMMEEKHSC